jgi:CRP-like cAMP-binding protein
MGQLLELIPTNLLEEVSRSIEIKQVDNDQVVFHEGQEAEGMYTICHGSLKLVKNMGKSNEQIVLLSAPNEMMGISSIFNGEKLHYTAIAMEYSQICFMPRKLVMKLIETNPQVLMALMRKVNKTIEEIDNHTTLVMADDSETIVLKTMQELKGKFGTDPEGFIRIQMPVKDLANYLCMSKTNLYRVLNNLRERVILHYEVDRYRLHDH